SWKRRGRSPPAPGKGGPARHGSGLHYQPRRREVQIADPRCALSALFAGLHAYNKVPAFTGTLAVLQLDSARAIAHRARVGTPVAVAPKLGVRQRLREPEGF